jgi:calcineurin-like phosphoesterase family protein
VVQLFEILISIILVLFFLIGLWLIFTFYHKRKIKKTTKPHKSKIYFISDTHFGHKNIIFMCHRPFKSVVGMNLAMRKRWNQTVKKDDRVYFLGDFVFNGSIGYWINHLNGKKTFIEGNHDVVEKNGVVVYHKIHNAIPFKIIEYAGYKFYLVHRPQDIPPNWSGWVIYGHEHNNDISIFPFIDGERKRINVGVELINYRPISLDYLISLDLNAIKRKNTINSPTIYK